MSWRQRTSSWGRNWFAVLWLFIGLVSLFDGFLVVRFSDAILDHEKNPVGLYLLALNDGSPSIFLRTKAAGTLVVLSVFAALYRYRPCWAVPVTRSVAFFQGSLLLYLLLATPYMIENLTHAGNAWLYGSQSFGRPRPASRTWAISPDAARAIGRRRMRLHGHAAKHGAFAGMSPRG